MAEEKSNKEPIPPGCFKSELHARLKDLDYAVEYLAAAQAEGESVFRLAVRDVVEARVPRWVVVAESCQGCGSDRAICLFDHEPTADEVRQTEKIIGGMFCIKSSVTRIDELNEPQEVK